MERPISAASSVTNPSITSGTHHKRTPSVKNGARLSGSTIIILFVTNLRLLDLDLLPDWPNITVTSFGSQDARTRIRCAEFALYHLFRLYDPATTAEKLRPFFPPLEPLQSVNLRAALYRCLNELKKNGVLGKETVLRKTMLDECQGDKFWELCLGFSAIVLRKVTLEKKSRYGRPVAERLATAQSLGKAQIDSLQPLAIAHRAALGRGLEEKQQKGETYMRLFNLMVEKEADLAQRKVKTSEAMASGPSQAQMERLNAVEEGMKRHWVGSEELRDSLVHGDDCGAGDAMLARSFEELQKDGSGASGIQDGANSGLLNTLERATGEQKRRLRRWQSLHESMLVSKATSASSVPPSTNIDKAPFQFAKHRSLSVRDARVDSTSPHKGRHMSDDTPAHISKYDEILTAMRDELRRNRRSTAPTQQILPSKSAAATQLTRKPSVHVDTSAGAASDTYASGASSHVRSSTQTAVNVRPGIGRRLSSRSRSYQQPKVDSQRQPIPLKSELFSPLKRERRSGEASPVLASPLEAAEGGVGGATDGLVSGAANGFGIEGITPPTSGHPSPEEKAGLIDHPTMQPPALRPSLAERTRMSMAFRSSDDMTGAPASPPSTATSLELPSNSQPSSQTSPESTSQPSSTTLLDRTRQSISMAPPLPILPPAQKKPPPGHARSRTSITYPVSQFETPQKLFRVSDVGEAEGRAGKRDITPREQLFSPEAEYDSVFRTRPRVAVSPILGPVTDDGLMRMEGGGSLVEVGVDGM